ncbi:MAG: HDOD domain-containing protein [Sedimentisphaerales bacterium]|nr:HDOD domain-containing protein [Sedimentisphaerales bacterium]
MNAKIMPTQNATNGDGVDALLKDSNGRLPTLPMVAQKLVEVCYDENLTFAAMAQILEVDPALASRLLQVANSAYYGLRHKVTTLERAVGALGLKHVKTIALGFHLVKTLNEFSEENFKLGEFWRQSVFRGVLARQLAHRYCPARCEEAFLVGLLQDCGIPFLAEALGESYGKIWSETYNSPASLYKIEKELFPYDHIIAAEAICRQWDLPEILAEPITHHHRRCQSQPSMDEMIQLCQISYAVGTVPLDNPQRLSVEDMMLGDYCRTAFAIDDRDLDKLLNAAKQEYSHVAHLFADILPDQLNITNLLTQSKKCLSHIAETLPRDIFDLKREVERLQADNQDLKDQVETLRRRAQTDDMTGLAQREPLYRFLDRACQKASSGQGTLAVMFIDVDSFKEINNAYGHDSGDSLLQQLAQMLCDSFADTGCVCRYGGDEFVVGLMSLQLKQAVHLATHLSRRLREITLPQMVGPEAAGPRFSCSIGLLFCEAGSRPENSRAVLDMAEKQMCEVKQNGKDGLRYTVLRAEKHAGSAR